MAGVALVGLAAVVVLGVTLAGEDARETVGDEFLRPDVTVSGRALPSLNDSGDDPALGLPAPEVSSFDFSGQPASIEHDGTPKLILFLAHWCSHCRREVPAVQGWIDQNGIPAGVDFVSVATSISEFQANYPPDAWLEREGWTPRVVVDNAANSISTAFGLTGFPFYVLVDGSGSVVQRISGGVSPDVVGTKLQALAIGG